MNRIFGGVRQWSVILIVRTDAGRGDERNPRVGVGDGRELQEFIDAAAPFLIAAFQVDADAGAGDEILGVQEPRIARAGVEVFQTLRGKILCLVINSDFRAVRLGVDRQFDVMRRLLRVGPRVNHHWLAGRDQPVHAGGGDADALLPTTHFQTMEFGPEQQPAKHIFHLFADDAGTIINHGDPIPRLLGGGGAVGLQILNHHRDIRQNARFLTGIQRVVHRFLHRCQQRLPRIIKPQQMAVFGEEFADRDILLLGRHRLGGFTAGGLRFFNHGLHRLGISHSWHILLTVL